MSTHLNQSPQKSHSLASVVLKLRNPESLEWISNRHRRRAVVNRDGAGGPQRAGAGGGCSAFQTSSSVETWLVSVSYVCQIHARRPPEFSWRRVNGRPFAAPPSFRLSSRAFIGPRDWARPCKQTLNNGAMPEQKVWRTQRATGERTHAGDFFFTLSLSHIHCCVSHQAASPIVTNFLNEQSVNEWRTSEREMWSGSGVMGYVDPESHIYTAGGCAILRRSF